MPLSESQRQSVNDVVRSVGIGGAIGIVVGVVLLLVAPCIFCLVLRRRQAKAQREEARYAAAQHDALRKVDEGGDAGRPEGAQRVANVNEAKELYYREAADVRSAGPNAEWDRSARLSITQATMGGYPDPADAVAAASAAPAGEVPQLEPHGSSGVMLEVATEWRPSQPEPNLDGAAAEWQIAYADDGSVYYHNVVSGETSWEAPPGFGTGGGVAESAPPGVPMGGQSHSEFV